jgi:cell division protein FtsI/penicillin-binding protein 2
MRSIPYSISSSLGKLILSLLLIVVFEVDCHAAPRSVSQLSANEAIDSVSKVDLASVAIPETKNTLPVDLGVDFKPAGFPSFDRVVELNGTEGDKFVITDSSGLKHYMTPDPELQNKAMGILAQHKVPWGILVAIQPITGKVLAFASYSQLEKHAEKMITRATFPAASLFKIITAAAAVEQAGLSSNTKINFRGGNYTLNKSNYIPDKKRDKRTMSLSEALGRSINPAFGRVSVLNLTPYLLQRYAKLFGFDSNVSFEFPVEQSTFTVPDSQFETARTGAGFGDVFLSPLHAALITTAIANGGKMMRPYIVDQSIDSQGKVKYTSNPSLLRSTVLRSTAAELIEMMKKTVTDGTARKHFHRKKHNILDSISIAAKTGTLSGTNPKGRYHWFVATAPTQNPEIAIASLVIDPGTARINGTGVGRIFLEYYFSQKKHD